MASASLTDYMLAFSSFQPVWRSLGIQKRKNRIWSRVSTVSFISTSADVFFGSFLYFHATLHSERDVSGIVVHCSITALRRSQAGSPGPNGVRFNTFIHQIQVTLCSRASKLILWLFSPQEPFLNKAAVMLSDIPPLAVVQSVRDCTGSFVSWLS